MRLPHATRRPPRRDARWRCVAIVASVLVGACSLDSTGVEPAGSTGSGSSGDVASSSGGPSSSSGTGEGAGPGSSGEGGDATSAGGSPADGGGGTGGTSSGGGEGGEGAAGGRGGAGAGGGGGAGGEGGAGPLEWLKRVHGSGDQVVNDVALSRDGLTVYVVGTSTDADISVDGQLTLDTSGDDIFVAAVSVDGSAVHWFRIFGANGTDRGTSIAIGENERLFIGGVANGRDGNGDYFAPGLDPAPTNDWGFLVELEAATGAAVGGISWGNANLNDTVDVAITESAAIAVGTCRGTCRNRDDTATIGDGDDVIFASYVFDDAEYSTLVLTRPGNQLGVGVAAHPDEDAFVILGEMEGSNYDVNVPSVVNPSDACIVSSAGQRDGFISFYAVDGPNYRCVGAQTIGNSGSDVPRSIAYDGDAAFVAITVAGSGALGDPGPYVVKSEPGGGGWDLLVTSMNDSDAFVVALDGTSIAIGGRLADDPFIQRVNAAGALGDLRVFDGGSGAVRGLVPGADGWITAGWYAGNVSFGLIVPQADGRDGWFARRVPPQ